MLKGPEISLPGSAPASHGPLEGLEEIQEHASGPWRVAGRGLRGNVPARASP